MTFLQQKLDPKYNIKIKNTYFFLQNLVTDDKILSIKSEINGIHVKNSTWLQNLVRVKGQNESKTFQGKLNKLARVTQSSSLENLYAYLVQNVNKIVLSPSA